MEIQFKESSWYRVKIIPGKEQKSIAFLKTGMCNYPSDIIDKGLATYNGPIEGTSEQLTPLDNDGCSTITLLDDNGNEIWTNEDIHIHSRIDWLEIVANLEHTIDKAIELLQNGSEMKNIIKARNILENEQKSRQEKLNWR